LGSYGDLDKTERLWQSLKFIAGFAVEINETTLFDDIVLPFPSALERCDFNTGSGEHSIPPCGHHDFHWQIRLPAVDPAGEIRNPQEVVQEIADRVGLLGDLYRLVNHTFRLNDEHALKPNRRYPASEVVDRTVRSWFGEERNLDWFREHGFITLPRSVQESYHGPFLDARLPIYLEHFLDRGKELRNVLDQLGLDWDLSDYKPLSEFMPCPSYSALQDGDYDLIAVHYKFPYVYAVWLESPVRKVRATVKLTQCIHPEAVGIGGHFGHWSAGMPVARGKGINFNSLLPTDIDHIDMISSALDHCVQVKVYK
jgi:anaerobic selenocysteine-containing dehydrogenase